MILKQSHPHSRLFDKVRINSGAWRKPCLIALSLVGLGTSVWFGADTWGVDAQAALLIFGLAIIGWTLTSINDEYIAVLAALGFTLVGVHTPESFFSAMADPIVWLLIAAFIISVGVTASGLSTRMAVAVATRARSVQQLFYLLTLLLILTAFAVPSTSGRAALMLPIYIGLTTAIQDRAIVRALSLLFPVVILLSAVASLTGAGAHLVTAEMLWIMAGAHISFGQWMLLGLPFALASSYLSVAVILRMFLTAEERRQPLRIDATQIDKGYSAKWSRREVWMAVLLAILLLLWATEGLHGFHSAIVAIVGAMLVAAPGIGVVEFKEALKKVSWSLILFMAATIKLGEALVDSGAAEQIVSRVFAQVQGLMTDSTVMLLLIIGGFALLSHLIITSRTARASVLIPLIILAVASLGYAPAAITFMATAALGFCLTLPVCAKPLAMFGNASENTFQQGDLLRLSSVLMPIHLALLVLFSLVVWPALGLKIERSTVALESRTLPSSWQVESPIFDIPGRLLAEVQTFEQQMLNQAAPAETIEVEPTGPQPTQLPPAQSSIYEQSHNSSRQPLAVPQTGSANGEGINEPQLLAGEQVTTAQPASAPVAEESATQPSNPQSDGGSAIVPEPTPTEVVPTPTPTEVVPTPTPTEVVPTPTPTEVVPTPTPTEVVPTPTPTEVVPTPTPTEVVPTPTPTEVVPTPKPTEVVPTPTPTEVVPTPKPTEVVPTPTPTEVVPTPTPTEVVPTPAQPVESGNNSSGGGDNDGDDGDDGDDDDGDDD